MSDPLVLLAIAGTCLLAGLVKGVIGLGMPTVILALLTTTLGLTQAMALMLLPTAITNLWQAMSGGHGLAILRRIWPFLLLAMGTVWIGALALTRLDLDLLSGLLGVLIAVYSVVNLFGVRFSVPPRHERWTGLVCGAANGVLTGMTGAYAVPGVMYLQAIGMPRDMFVQAMGMLFGGSTLALAVALGGGGFLDAELGWLSLVALLPALLGMAVGMRVRSYLSEAVFRRVFFVSLLLLGAYIVATAASR
ncbi:sulfite exporter TauE/SafE family protein [Lutibaculum baratangense]|uniref:Probable membrane transporter protein n=1 Tax=Lutibaculum baratangense AMV1 TaxID=631454 RepID=V4RLS1_9HYPH|nr:sulfite exporter TauE/SafE family protein [Lutibaculum baratangense]ESR24200.1 hypothetical protein N177_2649 [Lutibaculum baratangense AMV1]